MGIGVRTVIFVGLFLFCTIGALTNPLLGVLGYTGHYMIGPESQWWEKPVERFGVRYSLVLAVATFAGILFNIRKLRFGKSVLYGQEKLLLAFLAIVWVVTMINPQAEFTRVDHPAVKFTKVVIFVLMLTHVVTDLRKLSAYMWVIVTGAFILGLQAYYTPRRSFVAGRLEGLGGPDFAESNFLPALMAGMLIIIAIQFMRSGWIGRIVCALAGVFGANTIILTRSRGALVGLGAGAMTALVLAPKKLRGQVLVGLLVAGMGIYYLTDPQFRQRASSITRSEEKRDSSAQSRIILAKAGLRMVADHPLGVGVANFNNRIGKYLPQYRGKDSHNTYVCCLTETGFAGFAVFLSIIFSGLWSLRRSLRQCHELPEDKQGSLLYVIHGVSVAMVTVLACGLTISLTYIEGLWWFLFLPTALARAVDNYVEDLQTIKIKEEPAENERKKPLGRRRRRPPRRRLPRPMPAGT